MVCALAIANGYDSEALTRVNIQLNDFLAALSNSAIHERTAPPESPTLSNILSVL